MRGKRAIINQMEDLPLMRRRRRGAGRRMRGMRRLTYAGKCSQPKAFSLRRSLLVSALTNYRYPLRLIHALNQRPRGTPILIGAGRAQHDRRGKAGSERRKACFHPGGSGFHLPRGWPGPLPVLFNRLLRHTQVLWYFLDSRKYRPSSSPSFSPPVPHTKQQPHASSLRHAAVFLQKTLS